MLQDNFQIYWEKKNRPKSIKIPETYTREEIICFSSQAIYISLLLGYFHKKTYYYLALREQHAKQLFKKTSSYLEERLDQRDKHERQLSTDRLGTGYASAYSWHDEDEKLRTIFSLKSRREWIVLIFPRLRRNESKIALLRQNF